MPDRLSIANLLSWLQIDRRNDAIKLCLEAERLRRRRHFSQAIEIVQQAVDLVWHDFEMLGLTLVYSSAIRSAACLPREELTATREIQRAVRNLQLASHNGVIAQLIAAQIQAQMRSTDGRPAALAQLERARPALQKLLTKAHEFKRPQQINLYEQLLTDIAARIEQLTRSLAVKPYVPSTPRSNQRTPPPATVQLTIPTQLIWRDALDQKYTVIPGRLVVDEIEAKYLVIEKRLHELHPVRTGAANQDPHYLRCTQHYAVIAIEGHPEQHVLVREQTQPDQTGQFIAVRDAVNRKMWIDEVTSLPPYTDVHIIGARRQWNLSTTKPPQVLGGPTLDPDIIGVVIAIVMPLAEPINFRCADLSNVNLGGALLDKADFTAVNLQNANLTRAKLEAASLAEAQLSGVQARWANLSKADLRETTGSSATCLRQATLIEAQLCHARLSKVDLRQANAESADFNHANLRGADLAGGTYSQANFADANLEGANLCGADLRGAALQQARLHFSQTDSKTQMEADCWRIWFAVNQHPQPQPTVMVGSFSGASLEGIHLEKMNLMSASFARADLKQANLSGARLYHVSLEEANLEEAELSLAHLNKANLNSAYLGRAILRGANLQEADLSNADLHEADLKDADVLNADLSRADLTDAKITEFQLGKAKSLAGAILPDGTIHP